MFCPKELAPNDISLTLEDVQLIIGILYCVGTVEISPQRIETLLICAQVDCSLIIHYLIMVSSGVGHPYSDILPEKDPRLHPERRQGSEKASPCSK